MTMPIVKITAQAPGDVGHGVTAKGPVVECGDEWLVLVEDEQGITWIDDTGQDHDARQWARERGADDHTLSEIERVEGLYRRAAESTEPPA